MFDTHAIARSLTAADLTEAQADAITAAVREAAEHDAAAVAVDALATKADIVALEERMTHFATKEELRAENAALELRLVKWIVGTGVACAGLVIAALRLLGSGS